MSNENKHRIFDSKNINFVSAAWLIASAPHGEIHWVYREFCQKHFRKRFESTTFVDHEIYAKISSSVFFGTPCSLIGSFLIFSLCIFAYIQTFIYQDWVDRFSWFSHQRYTSYWLSLLWIFMTIVCLVCELLGVEFETRDSETIDSSLTDAPKCTLSSLTAHDLCAWMTSAALLCVNSEWNQWMS